MRVVLFAVQNDVVHNGPGC